MKKVCAALITAFLISALCGSSMRAAELMYGDLNDSKSVDSIDYAIMKSYLLGMRSLTGDALTAADVNGDGSVNSIDYAIMKQYLLGIISVFPASEQVTPTPQVTLPPVPEFKYVTVHDPSIIKTNDTYYIIGSHLAAAKSKDLIRWEQISNGVSNSNPLMPNVYIKLKTAFEWAETDTLWAGDWIQLKNGKYYMYYCMCKGDSPRSALGVAVSDNIEGPYEDLGIILKSGMWGQKSEDGTVYDATKHPNVVDPHVFYDKDGKLWMVYGSYSGGIFILKMDENTGKPVFGQGYGKRLLGLNHSRIEGAFIQYSPETDYYYMFLSFGGLDASGGYNIRVCRSKNPDGPYVDSSGKNMINCHGANGTMFDDKSIEPYGAKLMGNFYFADSKLGYVSPGHNSTYYDEVTNKYFIVFHTRFPGRGEEHQVRVHQMFINSDGWHVIAPHQYAGETIGKYTLDEVSGTYAYINHGTDISASVKSSSKIFLNKDGTVSGSVSGRWNLIGDNKITLTIGGVEYNGVVLKQYDAGLKKFVMTFTALQKGGNTAIWGSGL
ncbi:family 43 glycosylhydrolase [Acetivibrio clariflavus]|uniref:Beta-xylosidase n=1 Tax=Acetivibrio clariflavus (strain DSM 19732 / NBRC 101661 / EBR45) TaxID=720554 RepID=G8LUU7_ACECE|nr:family 43 glycosylhydrolase [Acetivibrio clariflavus]AEV68477.1 beta-xylosidase [Acetivibrio clariflavus DSM 19732]